MRPLSALALVVVVAAGAFLAGWHAHRPAPPAAAATPARRVTPTTNASLEKSPGGNTQKIYWRDGGVTGYKSPTNPVTPPSRNSATYRLARPGGMRRAVKAK